MSHHQPRGPATPAEGHARDFEYIDRRDALEKWVREARQMLAGGMQARCCIDTEADSLHHFQEKLCLIQIAFDGRYALVDPLAIADVGPLIALLDECELWIHGADYDLTMLRKAYGWIPKTVRDTQIAARLVGHRKFGLAALVESVFGRNLSKASQKEDWSRRPLPETMLRYAVDDVRYLLPLADHLGEELRTQNRHEWFLQSCRSLQAGVAARSISPREDGWRMQGAGRLQPKGLALLKAFWEWRDSAASERDIPCFRVMSNKQMLDYAVEFEAGRRIAPPAGWRPRWKRDFSEVVAAIAASDPASWPARLRKARGRLSDEAREHVEKLCRFRDEQADRLGIEGSLLGSRATLEQVVASSTGIEELLPWQRDLLDTGLKNLPLNGGEQLQQ
ncbi:MAG: HRDC domain-containing protein [Verrucomicrobiaceae bacterium]|nr:HRDC domain-containing protein [Verrucomicrobiaceae bacterium]